LSSCDGSVSPLPRQRPTIFAASVTDPPPRVTIRSAPVSRAAFAAATTSIRGVWGPIFAQTSAQRLPSMWRSRSTVSVVRESVPLARMNTARASIRLISCASASSKRLPKMTLSIAGNR